MANLIVGDRCNLNCPFCFASERKSLGSQMSVSGYLKLLSFIKGAVRFCGGEPTLHPNFVDMLGLAIEANGEINIMTNGLWPDSVCDFVSDVGVKHHTFHVLLNVLHPSLYDSHKLARVHKTLQTVNPWQTTLGFTIYKKDFDYQYALDLARQYGIKRLRLSIAAPSITGPQFLDPDKDFRPLSKVVANLVRAAPDLELAYDCGYLPPCVYDTQDLHDVTLLSKGRQFANFRCNCPLDIGPDGKAWRCYGLYSWKQVDTADFVDESHLEAFFVRRTRLLDNVHLFDRCNGCVYKRSGVCGGGCYALRLRRLLQKNPEVILDPVDDDVSLLKTYPYQNSNALQIWYRGNSEVRVNSCQEGEPLALDENLCSLLLMCDGTISVETMVERWLPHMQEARYWVLSAIRVLFEKNLLLLKTDLLRT